MLAYNVECDEVEYNAIAILRLLRLSHAILRQLLLYVHLIYRRPKKVASRVFLTA